MMMNLQKSIFNNEMKKNKCQIHQARIFGKPVEGVFPLLNGKCRHCKKIEEEFKEVLKKRRGDQEPIEEKKETALLTK